MKANPILLISAMLAICASGFSQPPKIKTGVFLTTDQGDTWNPASTGLPDDTDVSAWVVTQSNTVLMTTLNYGVFRSTDGKSWNRTSAGLPKNTLTATIAVHGGIPFIGSYEKGIFASHDNGNSWKASSSGLGNMSIRCFYSQDNTLFAGTDKGIYASANYGVSWTHVTGNMQINDFKEADGVLIAGTSLGPLRSENHGVTWDSTLPENAQNALATDSVQVFSSGDNNHVYIGQLSDRKSFMPDLQPASQTFRITPVSPPVLLTPWKNVFRSLRENKPFRNTGLPADVSFSNILVTPFGILVAQKNSGC
jgi:hypothetical protein